MDKNEMLDSIKRLLKEGFDNFILITDKGVSMSCSKKMTMALITYLISSLRNERELDDDDIEVLVRTIKAFSIKGEKDDDEDEDILKMTKKLDKMLKELVSDMTK